ncbi:MAG: glycosyltransferase family 25 protein [Pseudomonadota bacterium]
MDRAGWVINLASSPDRMAHAHAELSRAGLETRRIEAYDGRGKDLADFEGYDDARTRRFMGRSMSAGELGCYLSHIRALTAFLESPEDVALILEDDFQWTEGGPDAATTAMDWLAENSHWHAINVGASKRKITSPLEDLSGRELVRAHYFPMLAHAMIWSRAGAEALLAVATPIFCPADNMYRHVLTRSDKGLALYPPAASAGAFDSDITARSTGGSRSTQARSPFYGWRKQKRLWTEKLIATTHKARLRG